MHKKRAGKLINAAFAREDWEKARDIIIGELKRAPKDHWLLTRLSTTYYEQKNYQQALQHVDEVAKIKPDCPLVLWDLAGTLDALGKHQEAIDTYMKIFDKPTQELVDGPCGEGFDWAHALLTDCVFRLGVCFERLGKKKES
ncbi:MAG: tetratricopeptide repeat protein, partial [Gemmataceae bacterium]|nr:tetratricopeptide repeat protein [Gemmataceae bacterium]